MTTIPQMPSRRSRSSRFATRTWNPTRVERKTISPTVTPTITSAA